MGLTGKKYAIKEIWHKKIVYYLGLSKLNKLSSEEKKMIEAQNERILKEIDDLKTTYSIPQKIMLKLDREAKQKIEQITRKN